ncbi:MAG: ABC transporter substrate binding protein [bacterium]
MTRIGTRASIRRGAAFAAVAALTAAVGLVSPGAAQRRPSVSLVLLSGVPAFSEARDGFLAELPGASVVELEPDLANARPALEALRGENPDVVVALGSSAALAVSEYLPTTPLVFGLVLQPDALHGPHAARVGFSLAVQPAARLAALTRAFTSLKRVAVLCGPDDGAEAEALRKAGESHGIRVDVLRADRADEISPALDGLDAASQVLLLTTDPVFLREDVGRAVVMRAFERRVPVVSFSEKTVRLGALAALEIDYRAHGGEIARAALAVSSGREPGYRLCASTQVRWVVNSQTAKSLGIRFPAELLSDADTDSDSGVGWTILGFLP